MIRILLAGVLVLAIPPRVASSQDDALATLREALESGRAVRIALSSPRLFEGRPLSADDSTVTLAAGPAPAVFRLLEVERLWVRHRATGRGALLGAGAGIGSLLPRWRPRFP